MNNNEAKELKELKTILKNNGKDNPFENRILAKLIKTIEQLLQLEAENERLTRMLEFKDKDFKRAMSDWGESNAEILTILCLLLVILILVI